MHGGMTAATVHRLRHLSGERSVERLVNAVNHRARRALESWTATPSGRPTSRIHDPLARFVLNYDYAKDGNDTSPVLVHPLDKCDEVMKANKLLGIEAQVVGHTPHDPPQYSFCHGELLAIDFHMSQWKGGEGAAFAALQLTRGPRRHNHTFGPSQGALGWHTSLIVPNSRFDDEPEEHLEKTDWRSFAAAVVLGVVVVELLLLYIRRCCCATTERK
mmetsp:Transcript_52511/g.161615  ORF Transcript_52511/g.161615 Transcript_52511/m.161615 type:complete len:217 (+) Transcript_52511:545-1195(+)